MHLPSFLGLLAVLQPMSAPILLDNNLHKLVFDFLVGVEVDQLKSVFGFDEDVVFFP